MRWSCGGVGPMGGHVHAGCPGSPQERPEALTGTKAAAFAPTRTRGGPGTITVSVTPGKWNVVLVVPYPSDVNTLIATSNAGRGLQVLRGPGPAHAGGKKAAGFRPVAPEARTGLAGGV